MDQFTQHRAKHDEWTVNEKDGFLFMKVDADWQLSNLHQHWKDDQISRRLGVLSSS
jgi:hypothetical protein